MPNELSKGARVDRKRRHVLNIRKSCKGVPIGAYRLVKVQKFASLGVDGNVTSYLGFYYGLYCKLCFTIYTSPLIVDKRVIDRENDALFEEI